MDENTTDSLLSLYHTKTIIRSHCTLRMHPERLDLPASRFRRSCGCEKENKIVIHLICSDFIMEGQKSLRIVSLTPLTELSNVKVTRITRDLCCTRVSLLAFA